jgi:DNA repair protein RadC
MNIQLKEKDLVKIANSDDVFGIMQKILLRENKLDREKEHFWLVGLNNANKILFIELVSIGGAKSTVVEPMNVFRMSILKGAIKVILVHNHPSGELTPSNCDMDLTDRLIQAGKIIDIMVIDHLVITEKTYMSFGNTGRMKELEGSTKWVPDYVMIDRIKKQETELRKQAIKIAKEKGEKTGHKKGKIEGIAEGEKLGIKKGKLEMAKQMKQKGYNLNDIMELTGLTKAEIERLNF